MTALMGCRQKEASPWADCILLPSREAVPGKRDLGPERSCEEQQRREPRARKLAADFLTDPALPKCSLDPGAPDWEGRWATFRLAGLDHAAVHVDTESWCVSFFNFPNAEEQHPTGIWPEENFRIAREFARRHAPRVFEAGDWVKGHAPSDAAGEVHLSARRSAMWLPERCEVHLRGGDGKVVMWVDLAHGQQYRIPPVKIDRGQALRAATAWARQGTAPVTQVVSVSLYGDAVAGGRAYWRVRLLLGYLPTETSVGNGLDVRIDANTGTVLASEPDSVYLDERERSKYWDDLTPRDALYD